jgi:hypothetical protein
MITRCILLLALGAGLGAGCSTKPRQVSAAEFQKQWQMRHAQTVHWYSYLGETTGNVYILRRSMPLVGSKWKEEVLFTATNGLPAALLDQMRAVSKLEPDGAANRSQPIQIETNPTSSGAGSGR